MLEFTLTPVDKIPVSRKKRRKGKIKIDELEIKHLQTKFPDVYRADYIQELYKRLEGKKIRRKDNDLSNEKEIPES